MIGFLIVVHTIVSILLVSLVLMQASQGGGLSGTFGGQAARAGNIIIRQRGTKYIPAENVGLGKDHTIFALVDGTVVFKKKRDNRSYVSVEPAQA